MTTQTIQLGDWVHMNDSTDDNIINNLLDTEESGRVDMLDHIYELVEHNCSVCATSSIFEVSIRAIAIWFLWN